MVPLTGLLIKHFSINWFIWAICLSSILISSLMLIVLTFIALTFLLIRFIAPLISSSCFCVAAFSLKRFFSLSLFIKVFFSVEEEHQFVQQYQVF